MALRFLSLFLSATTYAATHAIAREACKPCNPQGATNSSAPVVGPAMMSLYVDVLASVKDIHFKRRWTDNAIAPDEGFCCRESLDCVKVNNLNMPICYDKYTTHFAFIDDSWGSLTTGDYNGIDGSTANLLTGAYSRVGGESGDIYAVNPAAKPNTATMSIPPQWTAAGIGSAIPPTDMAKSVSDVPVTTAATATAAPSASSTGAAGHVTIDSSKPFSISFILGLIFAFYAA
ncbi:hypothetical protein BU24DRAFT_412658 [Aaosphaeria arxii CBS 175.79]|uniref:Uncharacterized protein n=1 Tax=Aaosphaeria arxii CBS 175.79 TaxID=1450172 RepID=A0A6A5XGU4_9PLEO|nr:uncharacterized protein BU24DRAFT_412658 [Aaosphaeria arxii CBS 175.79]KAF2012130.1 hypothetical protein BU24DRAFT_412658 [Aaosphaeria arxii CBS 175.79]